MQPEKVKTKNSKIELLHEKSKIAEQGGGLARVKKQKESGKLTARERIEFLLDENSFEEFDKFVTHRSQDFGLENSKFLGDGVITGHGLIDGREVFVFAQDFTVFGGSLSETHAEKICKVMDFAMKSRRTDHRFKRFGRRTHPGRRSFTWRICRYFPEKHFGKRCCSPNQLYSRSVCRRSRLFTGNY